MVDYLWRICSRPAGHCNRIRRLCSFRGSGRQQLRSLQRFSDHFSSESSQSRGSSGRVGGPRPHSSASRPGPPAAARIYAHGNDYRRGANSIAIAVDESGTTRIDVVEGQVYVQHTLLPKGDGTVVRAVDAILVRPKEPISRHLDRGAIYRLAIKPLRNVFTAITFGHFVPASYNVWG